MTEEVDLPETSYRFRAAPDPKTEKFKLTRDIYGSLYGLEGVKEGGLIKRVSAFDCFLSAGHVWCTRRASDT
jgi:hypothetical protein